MVYRGKPSKGCYACRQRKIRCDQTALPAGCTQCKIKGLSCPGYRDHLDLMFANETESVARKAKTKDRTKNHHRSCPEPSTSPQLSTISSSSQASVRTTPPPPNGNRNIASQLIQFHADGTGMTRDTMALPGYFMQSTMEERGEGYFFSNYVADPGDVFGHTFGSSSDTNALNACVSAVGLAGLSSMSRDSGILREARKFYGYALRATNKALSSPAAVKDDSTLLSVIILGAFETLAGSDRPSLAAWANHVHGAAALLKLRGFEQLRTLAGRQMYAQVAFSLLTSCLQRDMPIPEYVLSLRDEASRHMVDPSDRAWKMQNLMLSFTDFSGRLKQGYLPDPMANLSQGLELEAGFEDLMTKYPEAWAYRTVYTDQHPEIIIFGYYHVYTSFWAAQLWNGLRSMRIMLNGIIRDSLIKALPASESRTKQVISCEQTMYALQRDIIASVPQQIGRALDVNDEVYFDMTQQLGRMWEARPTGKPTQTTLSLLPFIRLSGGYSLLWPLFVVGVSYVTTNEAKNWAIRVLRIVGTEMGIKQALVVAGLLETNTDVSDVHRDYEIGSENSEYGQKDAVGCN